MKVRRGVPWLYALPTLLLILAIFAYPVVTLVRSQFEEHEIALTGDALSEAVRVLLTDRLRGAVFLASDPDPIGVAVAAFTWTLEHGGLVAWLDERVKTNWGGNWRFSGADSNQTFSSVPRQSSTLVRGFMHPPGGDPLARLQPIGRVQGPLEVVAKTDVAA